MNFASDYVCETCGHIHLIQILGDNVSSQDRVSFILNNVAARSKQAYLFELLIVRVLEGGFCELQDFLFC